MKRPANRFARGLDRMDAPDAIVITAWTGLVGYGLTPHGWAVAAVAAAVFVALIVWYAGTDRLPPAAGDILHAVDFSHGWAFQCPNCERVFVIDARLEMCTLATCPHMAKGLHEHAEVYERELADGTIVINLHWAEGKKPDAGSGRYSRVVRT